MENVVAYISVFEAQSEYVLSNILVFGTFATFSGEIRSIREH